MTAEIQRLIAERRRHLEAAAELDKMPIMKSARETHLRMASKAQEKIKALLEAERNAK